MSIKIAVLGSTRGTNLEPLFRLLASKQIGAEIVLVVSNREDALILERAKQLGIPAQFLADAGISREAYGKKLTALLQQHHIDLIVLIGFMRILAADFTKQWAGHIINIHPSLLPKHAGLMDLQVHRAAIAAGDTASGCTVHLVDEQVDGGKILVQKSCAIAPDETDESLKAKVQVLEVPALLDAIEILVNLEAINLYANKKIYS